MPWYDWLSWSWIDPNRCTRLQEAVNMTIVVWKQLIKRSGILRLLLETETAPILTVLSS